MSNRHALLVGINAYPHLPAQSQLKGPVNDVAALKAVLTEEYGWAEEEVVTLTDSQATRDAILDALDTLAHRTKRDDEVLFFYAGHGSQVKDVSEDEVGGWDSTIVPHDSGRLPENGDAGASADAPPNRDILDDELREKLGAVAVETTRFAAVFDCCHSGTITRGEGGTPRQVVADPRPPEGASRTTSRGLGTQSTTDDRYVKISGCQDNERAFEYEMEEAGTTFGTLSYHLCDELKELKRTDVSTTYRNLFARVSARIRRFEARADASLGADNPGKQHPLAEGRLNREVFGARELPSTVGVHVSRRSEDQATLNVGAAHLVSPGSLWTVYGPGESNRSESKVEGELQVTSVGSVSSEARVLWEVAEGVIGFGSAAELVVPAPITSRPTVPVSLHGDPSHAPEAWQHLINGLNQTVFIVASPPGGPSRLSVCLVGPGGAVPEGAPPIVGSLPQHDHPTLVVVDTSESPLVDASGSLLVPPVRATGHHGVAQIVDSWARFLLVREIENHSADLLEEVSFEVCGRDEQDKWVPLPVDPALGVPVISEGQSVQIGLRNTGRNAVHVGLLDIRPTGEIAVVFPTGDFEPLEPKMEKPFYFGGESGVPMEWHSGFPYGDDDVPPATRGLEVLKAIVSRSPMNFRLLAQPPANDPTTVTVETPRALTQRGTAAAAERPVTASRPLTSTQWATITVALMLER